MRGDSPVNYNGRSCDTRALDEAVHVDTLPVGGGGPKLSSTGLRIDVNQRTARAHPSGPSLVRRQTSSAHTAGLVGCRQKCFEPAITSHCDDRIHRQHTNHTDLPYPDSGSTLPLRLHRAHTRRLRTGPRRMDVRCRTTPHRPPCTNDAAKRSPSPAAWSGSSVTSTSPTWDRNTARPADNDKT